MRPGDIILISDMAMSNGDMLVLSAGRMQTGGGYALAGTLPGGWQQPRNSLLARFETASGDVVQADARLSIDAQGAPLLHLLNFLGIWVYTTNLYTPKSVLSPWPNLGGGVYTSVCLRWDVEDVSSH